MYYSKYCESIIEPVILNSELCGQKERRDLVKHMWSKGTYSCTQIECIESREETAKTDSFMFAESLVRATIQPYNRLFEPFTWLVLFRLHCFSSNDLAFAEINGMWLLLQRRRGSARSGEYRWEGIRNRHLWVPNFEEEVDMGRMEETSRCRYTHIPLQRRE